VIASRFPPPLQVTKLLQVVCTHDIHANLLVNELLNCLATIWTLPWCISIKYSLWYEITFRICVTSSETYSFARFNQLKLYVSQAGKEFIFIWHFFSNPFHRIHISISTATESNRLVVHCIRVAFFWALRGMIALELALIRVCLTWLSFGIWRELRDFADFFTDYFDFPGDFLDFCAMTSESSLLLCTLPSVLTLTFFLDFDLRLVDVGFDVTDAA